MNSLKKSIVPDEAQVKNVGAEEHVHGPNCNHGHQHAPLKPVMRSAPKVGRNDPCPCGSLKKFKKCCDNN